jgi:translocation and assembly module TamB
VVLEVVEVNSKTGPAEAREPKTPEPASANSGAGVVALDIKVDLPGRVFVRGRGLDGEWRGKLTVTGSSAAPIIVGSLQVVRGSVNVLDKLFTLKEGTISFTGGSKIDPGLDMQAETNAGDITGTVKISGTASAPVIKIGSQPELPQDEVLARILFGKSVSQITPTQGLRLAAAAASLVGGGPGYLDRVRTALGLDRFDIGGGRPTTGATQANGLASTTVSAGKYVADGVYVGVDQGLSTSTSRAKVEIEITPNISVETRVGMSGGNALGLNWKMDY